MILHYLCNRHNDRPIIRIGIIIGIIIGMIMGIMIICRNIKKIKKVTRNS